MASEVGPAQSVLLVGTPSASSSDLQSQLVALQSAVTESGKVALEQLDRLTSVQLPTSSYDRVLCGMVGDGKEVFSNDVLAKLLTSLKPGGKLVLAEPVGIGGSEHSVLSKLKLSGFVDSEAKLVGSTVHAVAAKPQYEVGASARLQLSFAKKPAAQPSKQAVKVWQLSAEDFDDDLDDILGGDDGEDLLDEEDIAMATTAPKQSDCSTKKRACKGCTCGRAEAEATSDDSANAAESSAAGPMPASSCGNCYLGDAFRCSSCPYRGQPAFKPGEKITLTATQMAADK
eukprot:m.79563 g.79563  ORF g.79563 m.79563 type:complete len:287 (+) comp14630_c0_seq1:182-1042(+)